MVSYFNHSLSGQAPPQAVYQYLVSIVLPVTDNMVFLNQWKTERFSMKDVSDAMVNHGST